MRRLLLSFGLALVVGGSVLGAAATMNLSVLPLGAADAAVTSCSDAGTVYWSPPEWNGSYFQVKHVYVQGLNPACATRDIEVVLTGPAGAIAIAHSWGTAPLVVWDTVGTPPTEAYAYADVSGFGVNAALVTGIHVQISNALH